MRMIAQFLGRFAGDRRGISAVEFALLAPTLMLFFAGLFEMSLRFRAADRATRYAMQVADLVAREATMTNVTIKQMFDTAQYLMKPLPVDSNLWLNVTSVGYIDANNDTVPESEMWWDRYGGATGNTYPIVLSDANGLGAIGETVIRVGVAYQYTSPISNLFGGGSVTFKRQAFTRPRVVRVVPINGSDKPKNSQSFL